ncbi:oxidative damage protection protein [Enterobacter hormaechei]|nr:oxidative damage protection protein [Enterobacter hormaechei]MBD3716773.1 oxidative damage protection protein [Enterobacter hormaechei]
MARTIFCTFLQRDAEGRGFPALPGRPRVSAFTTRSPKKPRGQWQKKQTMLINEKKLSMMNPEHRKLLEQEMVNFLFEGKDVHIEGYTPPEK